MALQGSGAISLSDVQTEYGGSNPIAISEYYGSPGIPSSGALALGGSFHGQSNITYTVGSGGTVTTNGDYKIHTFTSSGTFTTSYIGTDTTATVDVVGGGGSGAGSSAHRGNIGCRGGSGTRNTGNTVQLSSSTSVTVGARGQGGQSTCNLGFPVTCERNHNGSGGGSSAFGSVTAAGGGGGTHGYSQTCTVGSGGTGSFSGYGNYGTARNNNGCTWQCQLGYPGTQGVVVITYKYQ